MTKKVREKFKYAFFIIFKGLSVAKNCLRPESVPLTNPMDELHSNDLHFSRKKYEKLFEIFFISKTGFL